jgi:hypothetical protein
LSKPVKDTSDPYFALLSASVMQTAFGPQLPSAGQPQVPVPQLDRVEPHMAKMSIFLGGFLVLTILIGVLATIPPA